MADVCGQFTDRRDRCPVVLVLDTSSSMEKDNSIGQLNEGLEALREALNSDPSAALCIQVAIVTFDSEARLAQDFVDAMSFQPPALAANGMRAMGRAMDLALDLVEKQKHAIRAQSLSCHRPWIWLMSDGVPNDDWEASADRVRATEAGGKAIVFAVGIGEQARFDVLGRFASRATPLELRPGKFAEMFEFEWLSTSIAAFASQPKPTGRGPGRGGARRPPRPATSLLSLLRTAGVLPARLRAPGGPIAGSRDVAGTGLGLLGGQAQ